MMTKKKMLKKRKRDWIDVLDDTYDNIMDKFNKKFGR
jgi:hypothetical protein